MPGVRLKRGPQPPTTLNSQRGHPHPTTVPARTVRVGTAVGSKAGSTPRHPHDPPAPNAPDPLSPPSAEPPTTSTPPPHPTETAQWTPSGPSPYSA